MLLFAFHLHSLFKLNINPQLTTILWERHRHNIVLEPDYLPTQPSQKMNADAVAERINKSYTKEFNSINAAVDAADEDDELALRRCCTRARALLAELTIPLYHRIKTLLLLASIVGMSSNDASH